MATTKEIMVNGIMTPVTEFDHTAQEIDDAVDRALQRISNQNLLDNWYFADPINQRGQTEYTGAGYTIDRWRTFAGNIISLADDGIRIAASEDSSFQNVLDQPFPVDIRKALAGKTVTLSALFSEVNGGVGVRLGSAGAPIKISNPGLAQGTFTFLDSDYSYFSIETSLESKYSFSGTLVAAKLELGSEQTLAHQDADGNWVLNDPPPDKALELAKCQRYQVNITKDGDNSYPVGFGFVFSETTARIFIPLPAAPRIGPTPSIFSSILSSIVLFTTNGPIIPTGVTSTKALYNGVAVIFSISGGPVNTPCTMRVAVTGGVILDFNL